VSEASRVSAAVLDTGPLLARLLDAQDRDGALNGHVALRRAAKALAIYARELGRPVLEPVSPAGHRLAGAALLLDGDVALRPHGQSPNGIDVLLVEGAAVGPAALAAHATRMRAAGAARVWAFATDLSSAGDVPGTDGARVLSA
jgi:hypothetical protein